MWRQEIDGIWCKRGVKERLVGKALSHNDSVAEGESLGGERQWNRKARLYL